MKRLVLQVLFCLAWLLLPGQPLLFASEFPAVQAGGHRSPVSYPGMDLAWREEFEGAALDTSTWRHETGVGNDDRGELQLYQPENARVREGYLIVTARREDHDTRRFTSSQIATRGKRSFRHGRIDIRALLPEGQGIRPALCLLGMPNGRIGRPRGGEIDIMEMIGGQGREDTVYGTLHWEQNRERRYEGGSFTLPSGDFSDQFHVFSVIRDERSIRWLVDGHEYFEWDISPAALAGLREPFYLSVNLAVGGAWPGNPTGETVFPQHLVVDYIRVFEPKP